MGGANRSTPAAPARSVAHEPVDAGAHFEQQLAVSGLEHLYARNPSLLHRCAPPSPSVTAAASRAGTRTAAAALAGIHTRISIPHRLRRAVTALAINRTAGRLEHKLQRGGTPAALRPVGLNTNSSAGGRPRPYGRSAYTAAVQAQRREAWGEPPPGAAFSTGNPPA